MAKHSITNSIVNADGTTERLDDFSDRKIDLVAGRRAFIGSLGAGLVGATVLGSASLKSSSAQAQAVSDTAVFNFALMLEYLEAEFYLRAAFGRGLADNMVTGTGNPGAVSGGRQVPFQSTVVRNYAQELAGDEESHVRLLRSALAGNAASRPAINLSESFTIAARAAGLINNQQTFDPFADDNGFLVASYIFEDVGVTAYYGAAPLLTVPANVVAAAGLLATEAYHAGEIRTVLYGRGLYTFAQQISDLRNQLTGRNADQGIGNADVANITPTGSNGLPAARTTTEVLRIVYGNTNATPGLFFPNGLNGQIR